ncbi:thylakoid lumenal 17.9 kDa protein, chloroplastic isoform X1 [Nymphaea colorata]|nr:thylakoid lumenal 17.9 kDa protein, chloroplastic isoform X1 [Nymphaea colorata]
MNIAMVAQGLPPSLILPNAPEDRRCPQKWRPDGNPSAPSKIQISTAASLDSKIRPSLSSILTSAAVALSLLCSPSSSLAIPYPISSSSSPLTTSTPYFQAQNQQFGLEDGKIRPCPSMNPGCISTNPKSSSFAFPWIIPQTDAENPLQKIEDAIRKTQGNPKIRARESTPYGQYLQAEVDGGLGRDMLEFLVKEDVVAYRCMATKVTYIYPFTTAFGDSKGQHERLKKISDVLGWYAPDFETMNE